MENPNYAGSILSVDERQPPFWYDEKNRLWLYMGVDVASRCFTTMVWGREKKQLMPEFYRQLIRNCTQWGVGLPYELECESHLNSSYKETFLREGTMFQKVKIEVNNAQGKIIEREFGNIRYGLERNLEGFQGRPHARRETNKGVVADNK